MANQAMETKARIIFREALAAHYIDGIVAGDCVDAWLRAHKGWLPDPQEVYGDGTPLTQPVDEGDYAISANQATAMDDAKKLMIRLHDTLAEDDAHEERILRLVDKWLDDLPPRRRAERQSRSRSPPREAPQSIIQQLSARTDAEIRRLQAENARLQANSKIDSIVIEHMTRVNDLHKKHYDKLHSWAARRIESRLG